MYSFNWRYFVYLCGISKSVVHLNLLEQFSEQETTQELLFPSISLCIQNSIFLRHDFLLPCSATFKTIQTLWLVLHTLF